jgi:hypothetical protein
MGRVLSAAPVLVSLIAIGTQALLGQGSAKVSTVTATAKAGETISFTVTVDHPTNVEDSYISYTLSTPQNSLASSVALPPGKTEVKISYKIPRDARAGRYELTSLAFVSPSGKRIPFTFEKVGYDVTASTGFEFPSGVKVAISPSQVQLFRSEAQALAKRLQELKGNENVLESKGPQAANQELRSAVRREMDALKSTDEKFRSLGLSTDLSRIATVFFADLELSYSRTEAMLAGRASQARGGGAIELAFFRPGQGQQRIPLSRYAREAVYRAAEDNELAYNQVAETGDMSFSLRVVSSPAGATISYARRGDSLQDYQDPTSATIPSLPLAIWRIHFHKTAYQDQEREFNPFTEHERSVDVTLHPLGK